jgi:hypothetical protein
MSWGACGCGVVIPEGKMICNECFKKLKRLQELELEAMLFPYRVNNIKFKDFE